jgi:hypothetical protein
LQGGRWDRALVIPDLIRDRWQFFRRGLAEKWARLGQRSRIKSGMTRVSILPVYTQPEP